MTPPPPLPARWERHLERNLVHVIDVVYPGGVDEAAQPVNGKRLEQQPCLIEHARSRQPTDGSLDVVPRYTVTLRHDLAVDNQVLLANGRTRHGEMLLPTGRIVNVEPQTNQDYIVADICTVIRN